MQLRSSWISVRLGKYNRKACYSLLGQKSLTQILSVHLNSSNKRPSKAPAKKHVLKCPWTTLQEQLHARMWAVMWAVAGLHAALSRTVRCGNEGCFHCWHLRYPGAPNGTKPRQRSHSSATKARGWIKHHYIHLTVCFFFFNCSFL